MRVGVDKVIMKKGMGLDCLIVQHNRDHYIVNLFIRREN